MLEHKFAAIDADAVSAEGVISGYATRFGLRDQGGDIVAPGAYRKSLGERWPKMLWSHDTSQPIGVWHKVEEDSTGLRVEGKLLLSTSKAREVFEYIKAGAADGLSIGYRTVKAVRQGTARLLQEVDLHEVSVVVFPMQGEASIDSVKSAENAIRATKSGDYTPLKKAVEGALRDAGFPAWMAKAQAAIAPNALSDVQRDADAGDLAKLIRDSFKL